MHLHTHDASAMSTTPLSFVVSRLKLQLCTVTHSDLELIYKYTLLFNN